MRLHEVVATHDRVASTRARNDKIAALAALLDGRDADTLHVVVPWLAGELRQGRIGVGYAALSEVRGVPPAHEPELGIAEVDRALGALADISGKGSQTRRQSALRQLLGRATAAEQRFLVGLLAGELRQGALAGVMTEAVAQAAHVPAGAVRRATMLSGDLVAPALAAFDGGEEALDRFRLQVGRPVQPMLAQTAEDVEDAILRLRDGHLEAKLDGARIQVHRDGDRVEVWSRQLRPVTRAVPEVVEAVLALQVRRVVLDGEVLAMAPGGRPHPFQTTMRRFGRRLDVAALRRELPLTPYFFDVLHVDDDTIVDQPLSARSDRLERIVPADRIVARERTGDATSAARFLDRVLDAGHEGIMAKDPGSPYEAGSRGAGWLKVKPAWTLDLVVLAAEWGSGRRQGKLSNLHLGARDPGTGRFVMLGKTFKGLTDALLAWQTVALLEREVHREGHVVFVRPELVVEVAFNEVQASPRYPGGVALRFARVKGYRLDKRPEQADTIGSVRAIHAGRARRTPTGRPST